MGTKVLNDIYSDVKRLITALTSFEENEEGFQVCERFAVSNIKHHRYLSVNSHATKQTITDIINKFNIHGKYQVARKFEELVNTFLANFDVENHEECDLQWALLALLIDLSTETHKSDLKSIENSRVEHDFNTTTNNKEDIAEDFDWTSYLKEGQEDFFCDYSKSDSDLEWSDLDEEPNAEEIDVCLPVSTHLVSLNNQLSIRTVQCKIDRLSEALTDEINSKDWLLTNIQYPWWNKSEFYEYPVSSKLLSANLCRIWRRIILNECNSDGVFSEYQTLRELLWMFHVQTEMVIFQQNRKGFFICKNISIPSLTDTAFKDMLSQFCTYFSMLYEMEKFEKELCSEYTNESNEYHKPPFTYEAYNMIVKKHLIKYRNEIINIEKSIMKQESCNTLLTISMALKKYLNGIKMLYEIHKATVLDWKVFPNWKCASTLLSRLYFEMQNSHTLEKTNICANLYLCSFTVYLNIIDTWLTEGRLEDWRDEFIISRISKKESTENKECETFTVRSLDNVCMKDPIMQFLIRKLQHIGYSIELLVSLDRIADMWNISLKNNVERDCLNDEFYLKLLENISKYGTDTTENTALVLRENEETKYDADTDKNIIQQLSASHNPFFIKALEEYLPDDLVGKDILEKKDSQTCNTELQNCNLFEKLETISQYILPLRKILETTLSDILDSRYNNASKLVKNIMMDEYKLETHLRLLRSVYMMEMGHIMNKFNQVLFYEIEYNQIWSNSYFLSCILEEVLSQQWSDSSSRWSITIKDTNTHLVPQAVDNLTLHYAISWPISIVINEKALDKYNEIFRFLLKLKWALWTLNNLRFSDLEDSKTGVIKHEFEHFQIRRLETLRFWLLHAVGSIHGYLSGQVLQSLGLILDKNIIQAESLDMIILAHNGYLDDVHQHCLLTSEFEDIMATINNLIEMCVHVRDRWTRRKLLLGISELDIMESSYIKYHTYLALALHNAVQHKDADYQKLTPKRSSSTSYSNSKERNHIFDLISDLGRNLLAEIAHQNLPPSGIPIPIPRMIRRRHWQASSSELSLPDEISLNEYKQTFSYMRWYQCEEHFVMLNTSYNLCREMKDLFESQDDTLSNAEDNEQ